MTEFKLIVAGGRDFTDYSLLEFKVIELVTGRYKDNTVSIVSGTAKGADALGAKFAKDYKFNLYEFPADWNQYGKRAGFLRNTQMGEFSNGLLAFWDNQSKGTAQMIKYMRSLSKPVHVVNY